MATFQTISEYVATPFGNTKNPEKNRLEQSYQKLKRNIKINGYLKSGKEYFLHILVPSESNPKESYDVVILFFTGDMSVERSLTLKNYYIKLFSNSPSFIYQYAAMYHVEGYLIDFLFEKMDKEYAEVMPKKPKPLSWDKSLYCACRYLLDDKFISLSKMGIITKHRKTERNFFNDIKSFQDVKMASELRSLNNKIDKELEKDKGERKKERKPSKPQISIKNGKRISAKDNTLSPGAKRGITKAKIAKVHKAKKSTKH